MARYPGADWRPLPENESAPGITPTQLILHTAACRCGDSLYDDFNRSGNNLESHFYVQADGGVEQYVDTALRADANYKANVRAISVETQDDGDSTKPWSPAQLDAIVALTVWAIRKHPDIKARVCPAWDSPGLGYHTLFGSPSQWTPVAKSCPGPERKRQFPEVVRRVQAALAAPVPSGVTVFNPPLTLPKPIASSAKDPINGGSWLLTTDGAIYAFDGARYLGACNGKGYFVGRTARSLELTPDGRYTIVATSGEKYGPGF